MTWEVALILLIILLAVFLLMGFWIAFALGSSGIIILLVYGGLSEVAAVSSIVWNNLNSFVLTAIPLFLFMGELLLKGGVAEGFYRSVSTWVNKIPGGLLHANILGCGIFAAVSGSSPATAAAIGSVAYPEMKKRGYDVPSILGTLAAGGTLGILIPPSIAFIIYGANVGVSISKLFIAGIVPGILLVIVFMIYVLITSLIKKNLTGEKEVYTWKERFQRLPQILPIAILIVLIIGGIYLGIMTATESAAVGAFFATILALVYKKSWKVIYDSLVSAVTTTTMLLLLIVGAQIMSFAIVRTGISRGIVSSLLQYEFSPWVLMTIVILVYIALGFIVDGISMMLLTLPVLYPLIMEAGFNPIWFGVILVLLIELGQITPPVGLNLFVIQGISKENLSVIMKGVFPYCIILIIMVLLLCFVPEIATWLPSKMG